MRTMITFTLDDQQAQVLRNRARHHGISVRDAFQELFWLAISKDYEGERDGQAPLSQRAILETFGEVVERVAGRNGAAVVVDDGDEVHRDPEVARLIELANAVQAETSPSKASA